MGIRNDGVDTQSVDINEGSNPYTDEDMAIYSPRQIDAMCATTDSLMDSIDGVRNAMSALAATIERISPLLSDMYKSVEALERAAEYEEL